MSEHLRHALEDGLGSAVVGLSRVGGGSINEAYDVHLADGQRLFCKTHPDAPDAFFAIEAAGLRWLADADAVRVPQVVAVRDEPPAFLAMAWVEPAHSTLEHDAAEERLGQQLGALHRAGAPSFGWDRDGYIGDLPQANPASGSWPEFYRDHRLRPLVTRAVASGHLGEEALPAFERLYAALPELCGPPEPPARLHGDLWGGNVLIDRGGQPWLVDPACYGGHREVDLAMLRLFGGFGRRLFGAYDETYPLADGYRDRVPLYQLYPLLVHTILFGGAYAHQTMQALHRCI
jgi:fructosamine-3-kinase